VILLFEVIVYCTDHSDTVGQGSKLLRQGMNHIEDRRYLHGFCLKRRHEDKAQLIFLCLRVDYANIFCFLLR
jgi:hypothetical protein